MAGVLPWGNKSRRSLEKDAAGEEASVSRSTNGGFRADFKMEADLRGGPGEWEPWKREPVF